MRCLSNQLFRVLDHIHSAALNPPPTRFGLAIGILTVVFGKIIVEIKAAIEAGSKRIAVENHGSDEGSGLVSMFFSNSAAVTCCGESGIPKSVTPCTLGKSPVRIVMCEVFVIGL